MTWHDVLVFVVAVGSAMLVSMGVYLLLRAMWRSVQ